ncbi:MAG: ISL3 family transposase [archaeon]
MERTRKASICPMCNKQCLLFEEEYERNIKDLDLANAKCFLRINQRKIRCHKCGYRGIEFLSFAGKYDRVTKRLADKIAEDCEEACLKEVARRYHLNWKTVKEIDREHIKAMLPEIGKLVIRRIAIDEIAIEKGHKYFTIIRDYDTGIALKIIFGRDYKNVKEALETLGTERLSLIKYASLDMWDPYIKAIKECCPNAELVFDKFHVVKKINEAVDKVRKKEFAHASDQERIYMKHKRWVILHRHKNLKPEQKETLENLIGNNNRLYKAYLLKEQMLSIFDEKESTFEIICKRINTWMENVLGNELDEFHQVITTMKNYMYGILNYFKYGMTNAIAEGFNTKINVLKRRAFGFRDVEYFALKIYQSSMRRLS